MTTKAVFYLTSISGLATLLFGAIYFLPTDLKRGLFLMSVGTAVFLAGLVLASLYSGEDTGGDGH